MKIIGVVDNPLQINWSLKAFTVGVAKTVYEKLIEVPAQLLEYGVTMIVA